MRRRHIRKIYEHLCGKPRFRPLDVSKELGIRPTSVAACMKEAFEKGYIVGPQIRKKSFSNFRTYVYLVQSHDPIGVFEELVGSEGVIYHAVLDGFYNLLVMSDQNLNLEGTLLGGLSSDYYISHAPDQTWQASIDSMWGMVEQFDPVDYNPKGCITTHWDQEVEWGEDDEILYQEFKYDLRRPLQPLADRTGILVGRVKTFLEQLPEFCTVHTGYYPESLAAYDDYLYVFDTEYEDFVIDLFSQLSTTCWFQKVSDRLIAHIWALARPIGQENTGTNNITGLQIPLFVRELVKEEIVLSETHATSKCYWRKEINDI